MAYDLKIIGLANRDELKQQAAKDHRLYKFTLSASPDGFWVLLLQAAGRAFPDVTVSGNAGSTELWVSADASVSVKKVLDDAKRVVAQANADATASDAQFKQAAKEQAAAAVAAQGTLERELDELDFSEPTEGDAPPQRDLEAFDELLKASEEVSSTKAEPVEDKRAPDELPGEDSSPHE